MLTRRACCLARRKPNSAQTLRASNHNAVRTFAGGLGHNTAIAAASTLAASTHALATAKRWATPVRAAQARPNQYRGLVRAPSQTSSSPRNVVVCFVHVVACHLSFA